MGEAFSLQIERREVGEREQCGRGILTADRRERGSDVGEAFSLQIEGGEGAM